MITFHFKSNTIAFSSARFTYLFILQIAELVETNLSNAFSKPVVVFARFYTYKQKESEDYVELQAWKE